MYPFVKKEFLPYAEASTLKELGFDEACFGVYYPEMDGNFYLYTIDIEELGSNNSDKVESIACTAPTFSQAFRWFRETLNLIGIVEVGYNNGKHTFTYVIWNDFRDDTSDQNYETHEEAELSCLRELIKLVKY